MANLSVKDGAPKIAKLVNLTPISLGLRTYARYIYIYIELVNGIMSQLITGGAPPCSCSISNGDVS